MKALFRRTAAGEELTIGFFGGSITQGSLAAAPENCYAYRVYRWWCATFPQATFHYVNGGIGGTSAHYGVSRVVGDLLMYQPDFVVVDFSVNDAELPFAQETYDGVLRKILGWPSAPAVVLLNNIYYDSGLTAEALHVAVGDHYGVPHVSIRETLYAAMKAGRYTQDELTPDGLHPNDLGHGLVADEICKLLAAVNAQRDEPETALTSLPAPLTANTYEDARRLTIRECCPVPQGFRADTAEKTGHLDHWKNGWIGQKPGDHITFTVEGRTLPYSSAVHSVLLDDNFDEDWGDCLTLTPILHHGPRTTHTVELTILPCEEKSAPEFYLLALIVA